MAKRDRRSTPAIALTLAALLIALSGCADSDGQKGMLDSDNINTGDTQVTEQDDTAVDTAAYIRPSGAAFGGSSGNIAPAVEYSPDYTAKDRAVSPSATISPPIGGGYYGSGEVSPGDAEGLNDAILKAKTLVNTDSYQTFNYSINSYGDVTTYWLNWSGSSSGEPDLNMTVDANGYVYNYYKYYSNSYSGVVIPQTTKAQALDIAYNMVKSFNPEYADTISKDFTQVTYNRYGSYTVNLYRTVNGIRIDNNYISVQVNSDGTVSSYSSDSMINGIKMPSAPQKQPDSSIINVFKQNLPFTLVYRTFWDYSNVDYSKGEQAKATVRLVYELNNNYYNSVVDAETGKLYSTVYEDGGYYSPVPMLDGGSAKAQTESAAADSSLSYAETKAVNMQEGFLTVEQITAKLKNIPEFINAEYKLTGSNIYESKSAYSDKVAYFWNVSYTFTDQFGNQNCSASATVNAETGEIISFSAYDGKYEYKAPSQFKYTYDDCLNAANAFFQKYYSEKAAAFKLAPNQDYRIYSSDDKISNYYFSYQRYVNGILFYGDTISISVDPDTLLLESFNLNYTSDAVFPDPSGKISGDDAFDRYFSVVPLELSYIANKGTNKDGNLVIPSGSKSTSEKTLMLCAKIQHSFYIDALTGEGIDYSANAYQYSPIVYYKTVPFTDIKDSSYKTQIEALADMDIIPAGEKFNPSGEITQREFFEMLQYMNYDIYNKYVTSVSAVESGGKITGYFSLKQNDIDEDAVVTRETAAKIIVDALGFTNVAQIPGIFKCDLADQDQISADCYGYVTIANGLGLLRDFGSTFHPQNTLARDEAAAMVYRYLMYQGGK